MLFKNLTFPNHSFTSTTTCTTMPNRSDGKYILYNGTSYTLSGLTAATGKEPHGVSAQPLFSDEANDNFRTVTGSPVINAGTGSAAVPDDFNGTARPQGGAIDIGPYQYTGGDTTPPTISGVQATNLQTTTATIGWTTGEAATSQVQFGTTTDYGLSTPFDSGATLSHTVSLGRLLSGTGYHFRVVSVDAAGNIALSPDATFSTTSSETVTVLTSSQNPSASGSSVTFTATVSPDTATGTVTFLDGETTIGTATLGHGSGSVTTGSLAVGSHSLTAVYAGNGSYPASTSNTVTQVVEAAGLTASTTTLTSSVNPTTFGQATTLTATVSPDTATGTVTFKDGATTIGAATLGHGSGSLAISNLAVGSHSLTAVYGGDSNYAGSTSNTVTQTVNQATSHDHPRVLREPHDVRCEHDIDRVGESVAGNGNHDVQGRFHDHRHGDYRPRLRVARDQLAGRRLAFPDRGLWRRQQ